MELLSPAGHWEAMVAAVQSGADSVYFGCGGFNARRGAKNFTPEELSPAVAYCHLRGVKVYLTVNTLVTDRELAAAGDLLRQASRAGVDAVIVQDWGLAALAREIVPDLSLHGSTQMTVHSLAGVEAAARLGMGCVVLSREVSREDMAYICRHSPIKIEVFAHGALCMCYSGQCAMSALIGGRSGNRGACAQPCRLPYRLDEGKAGHPLSLKDACLVSHLRELRDMGVSILKLEGRMKRPEYVAVVTEIYARLLREDRLPTGEELRELEQAFSRQGFTDGYWRGRPGPGMFGVPPAVGEDVAPPAGAPKVPGPAAQAVGHQAVLRDHQGQAAVGHGLAGQILLKVPDLLPAELKGHRRAAKPPGLRLQQRPAVEQVQPEIPPEGGEPRLPGQGPLAQGPQGGGDAAPVPGLPQQGGQSLPLVVHTDPGEEGAELHAPVHIR